MARILIVDDSMAMRVVLEFLLTGAGHEVIGEASDGKQAVTQYFKLKPDLVTMDITMPVMSGVDALGVIMEADPKAKVIMVSALNQKHLVLEAIKKGAKHYILKPFDENKVLKAITEVIAK